MTLSPAQIGVIFSAILAVGGAMTGVIVYFLKRLIAELDEIRADWVDTRLHLERIQTILDYEIPPKGHPARIHYEIRKKKGG